MASREPLARAITYLTSHTGDPAGCPDLDVLVDWAEGLLSQTERSYVLDHVAGCPLCAPIAANLTVASRRVRDLHRAWLGWRGPFLYRLGWLGGDRALAHAYETHLCRCPRCARRAAAEGQTRVRKAAYVADLGRASTGPKRPADENCPQCRRPSKRGAKFCTGCGSPLTAVPHGRDSGKLISVELTVTSGPEGVLGRVFSLHAGTQTIGRGRGIALRLGDRDRTVSRRHAAIAWEPGTLVIRDLRSRSGTYVNGRRVGAQVLQNGDTIVIGQTQLVLRASTDT